MESFEIRINNIKLEKANAIHKHRQLKKMANLFRLIEFCAFLVLISRFTNQLPGAVKNSGEYFKDLSGFLGSPRFVFIIGNAIVITLFAKSGQFSAQVSATKNSKDDLYEEFVRKSGKSQNLSTYHVEYREKQSICEEKRVIDVSYPTREAKNYRRTQSENFKHVNCEKSCKKLRRCETEKCNRNPDSGDKQGEISYPEDNMSNEEFRYTIEAFIERQKRFRREEEISVI